MWRKITEKDLASKLSQKEIDTYRTSAGFVNGKNEDPISLLLNTTADRVRGYCRQNTSIRLSPEESSIPADLISPALDIVVFDVLKRMPMEATDPRKVAYDKALQILDSVAKGEYLPEPYGSTDEENDRVLPLYCFSFRPDMLI